MSQTLYFRLIQTTEGETEVEPVQTGDTIGIEPVATEGGAEEEEVLVSEATAEEELHSEAEEEVANPILPTSNELFYGALFFGLLWALFKFVLLPPILKVQEARAESIRADKDAAQRATDEAATLRSDYETGLAGARVEASRIIDDARHATERKRSQVMAQVDQEIAAERAQAAAEVEAARAAALEELKGGVAGLAVQAASIVVQKDIDAAASRGVVDDYVSRAEAR